MQQLKKDYSRQSNVFVQQPRTSLTRDSSSIIVTSRHRLDDFPGSSPFQRQMQLKATRHGRFLRRISRDPSSAIPLTPFGHRTTFYAFTLRGKCQRTVLNKYKKVTDWQWATYVPARRREGTALRGHLDMQTACVAAALPSKEHRASVTKRFSKYGIG